MMVEIKKKDLILHRQGLLLPHLLLRHLLLVHQEAIEEKKEMIKKREEIIVEVLVVAVALGLGQDPIIKKIIKKKINLPQTRKVSLGQNPKIKIIINKRNLRQSQNLKKFKLKMIKINKILNQILNLYLILNPKIIIIKK